jgi:hypothetical protein
MALNEDIRRVGSSGEGDPELARVYRAAPREEPPAHLDAALLAAARREVGARPRLFPALRAWRVPVGIAAVVVLSASLVTLMREEGGSELYQPAPPELSRSTGPAPRPSEGAAKAPVEPTPPIETGPPRAAAPAARGPETQDRAAPGARREGTGGGRAPEAATRPHPQPFQGAPGGAGERSAPASAADDAARTREMSPDPPPPAAVLDRAPSAAMSAPPPGAPPRAAAEAGRAAPPPAKTLRRERDLPAREDAPVAAAGPASASPQAPEAKAAPDDGLYSRQQAASSLELRQRVAAILKELDVQPAEKWLERIQVLRREGQTTEAREVLAEFKRRYPAHPLPAELQ